MTQRRSDPASLLPLGASAFHILVALAGEELHGYAVAKEVGEATDGAMKLRAGSLYRQLKQMVKDGWIAETGRDDDDAMHRRYYRLTPWGRRIAQAEAARLAAVLRLARAHRLLSPGE
jgi:DNA-binding PadR family transcriptional regulator